MRSSIAGLLAVTALAGCPFVTSGVPGATGGSGGGPASSTSTGGSTFCKPMETQPCYTGMPAASMNIAPCHPGTATCNADGSAFGPCTGEQDPAPDNCASKLNLHCDEPELACTGTPGPDGRTWGEMGDDQGLSIALDSQGNVVVAGYFHGTLDFGGGMVLTTADMKAAQFSSDAFVAQYDPTGALKWVVQLGDVGDDHANAVAVDASDNVYVAGTFANKVVFPTTPSTPVIGGPGIFVAKLDKTGKCLWGNGYVGTQGYGGHAINALALSPDGTTVAVAGVTSDKLTIGMKTITTQSAFDFDGFLFTLDSAGTLGGWAKQVKDQFQAYQSLAGVAVDTDGSIVVTGSANGDIDFGDGMTVTHPGNQANVALARYSKAGNVVWKHLFGADGGNQSGAGVALNDKGDVFLTGSFQKPLALPGGKTITMDPTAPGGTTAMFVARFDTSANASWGVAFTPLKGSAPNVASGTSVAADEYGLVVGGYFTDQLAIPGMQSPDAMGSTHGIALKLAVDKGTVLWAQPFGDMPDERVNGVALDPRNVDPLGASAVVGANKGDATHNYDIFFARLAP